MTDLDIDVADKNPNVERMHFVPLRGGERYCQPQTSSASIKEWR